MNAPSSGGGRERAPADMPIGAFHVSSTEAVEKVSEFRTTSLRLKMMRS